jgi:predicted nucleic acid-binding protein
LSLIYFDSSAFVKLLIQEEGSDLAVEVWDACDAALSSRLAYPEVCAALTAARRSLIVDKGKLSEIEASWEEFWGAVRPVELSFEVERSAGTITRRTLLRGADSIHLASALAVGKSHVIIAVWDRKLHDAALEEGFRVVPALIP